MMARGSWKGDFPSFVFLSIQYSSGSASRLSLLCGSSSARTTRLALLNCLPWPPEILALVFPILRLKCVLPTEALAPLRLVQQLIPPMLAAGIDVLIYAGDQDFICNWL